MNHSANNRSDRELDRKFTAYLEQARIEAPADFLDRIHRELQQEGPASSGDAVVDELVARKPIEAGPAFLSSLKQRIAETKPDTAGRRLLAFPALRWAAAAAAIAVVSAWAWLQTGTSPDSAAPEAERMLAAESVRSSDFDPETTRILALAQNLDPQHELDQLDIEAQEFLSLIP